MSDNFEIPVTYKGQELLFPASLVTMGYTYKIVVEVDKQQVSFEPDEERNFRAIISWEDVQTGQHFDKALLEAIAASLESLLK